MRYGQRVAWLAVIICLVGVGLRFQTGPAAPPQDPDEVVNRLWIDHLPHNEREPFRAFMLSSERDDQGRRMGGIMRADSVYKACGELLTHEEDQKELRFLFLHDNVKAVTGYQVERVPADADGLDIKLTLERDPRSNGRRTVYFSSTQWRAKGVPTMLRRLLPAFQ